MTVLASRYTQWQREAIAAAYTLTTATAGRVAELAAAGELEHPSGGRLGPFQIPEASVRSIARRARVREAQAEALAELWTLPPRDAVERLRCRLVDSINRELTRVVIEQEAGRPLDFRAFSGIARALRELAWLPGPTEPQPRRPGSKLNGVREGGETRGGLAGKILAAARVDGFS